MNIPGLSMDSVTAAKAKSIEANYRLQKRGKDPKEEEQKKAETKQRREQQQQKRAATAAGPAAPPKMTAGEKNLVIDAMTKKATESDLKRKNAKLRKIRRYHDRFPTVLGSCPKKLDASMAESEIDALLDDCRNGMASKNAAKQIRQLPLAAAKGVEIAVEKGYDPFGWGENIKGFHAEVAKAIQKGDLETELSEMEIELADWATAPWWLRFGSKFLFMAQMHALGSQVEEKARNNPEMAEAMRRWREMAETIRKQQQQEQNHQEE